MGAVARFFRWATEGWEPPTKESRPVDFDQMALGACYYLASKSPDPSTQNGAMVAWNSLTIGEGYNRFANGVHETPERWERPAKYDYVVHAEVAAVTSALRAGARMATSTLYVVWYACTDCAKVIIESGCKHVVGHKQLAEFAEEHSPGWTASIATALTMLDEAGVKCELYDGPVKGPAIRVGGQHFDPSLA